MADPKLIAGIILNSDSGIYTRSNYIQLAYIDGGLIIPDYHFKVLQANGKLEGFGQDIGGEVDIINVDFEGTGTTYTFPQDSELYTCYVYLEATSPPLGSALTVNVYDTSRVGNPSILDTLLTIPAGQTKSLPNILTISNFSAGAVLQVSVISVGSESPGAGVRLILGRKYNAGETFDWERVRLVNTGNGYSAIFRKANPLSYMFVNEDEQVASLLKQSDFYFNYIPPRSTGLKTFYYFYSPGSARSPISGYATRLLFTYGYQRSNILEPHILGLSSYFPTVTLPSSGGTTTTSHAYTMDNVAAGGGSSTLSWETDIELDIDIVEFPVGSEEPPGKPSNNTNYDLSTNIGMKEYDIHYVYDKNGTIANLNEVSIGIGINARRQFTPQDPIPYGEYERLRYYCENRHDFSITKALTPYVPAYANVKHSHTKEENHSGEYIANYTHYSAITDPETGDVVVTDETIGSSSGTESYDKKTSRTELLIEGINCSLYFNIAEEIEESLVPYTESGSINVRNREVKTNKTNVIPKNYTLCVRVKNNVYEIADFDISGFNYHDRVLHYWDYIDTNATTAFMQSPYTVIGIKYDNYGDSLSVWKTSEVTTNAFFPDEKTEEIKTTYSMTGRNYTDYSYLLLTRYNQGGTVGVVKRANITNADPYPGYYYYENVEITIGEVISEYDFFCFYNSFYSTSFLVQEDDWTTVIAEYFAYHDDLRQVNIYLVTDEQGGETVELAVSEQKPSNNDFNGAVLLEGQDVSVRGNNYGADWQGNDSEPSLSSPTQSVWYKWVAPSSTPVTIHTLGSPVAADYQVDTVIAVYTGSSLDSLSLVASNDDASVEVPPNGDYLSAVVINPVEGTTYYIQVDGYSDEQWSFVLSITTEGLNVPTPIQKETRRADIYRFDTQTLKWKRMPNAVSAISPLTGASDFISYHATPQTETLDGAICPEE